VTDALIENKKALWVTRRIIAFNPSMT